MEQTKKMPLLMGGIVGDIAGSRFEFSPIKSKEFELLKMSGNQFQAKQSFRDYRENCHFTDDTVMTLAVANALLDADGNYDNLSELVIKNMKEFGRKHRYVGYGSKFNSWLNSQKNEPYNSFGNGSAMRIGAVPYFAKDIEELKSLSRLVTVVTHNHEEGIKGAEAVASCIWLAWHNNSKQQIKDYVEKNYYNLDFDYDQLLKTYVHDESCQNSVPQSIYAFLISADYEDAIRTAISIGGDADTMACIAGSIAEAFYGMPKDLEERGMKFLTEDLKAVLKRIKNKFNN